MSSVITDFFSVFFRDLLLPDGNRVSAFSVASTAIAAAQWSSSQVRFFCLKENLCHCNIPMTHSSTFQPQQSSEGTSEYNYMPDGYPSMSQVSEQQHRVGEVIFICHGPSGVCETWAVVLQLIVAKLN